MSNPTLRTFRTVKCQHRLSILLVITALGLFGQVTSQAAKILYVINTVVDDVTTANAHDQEVRDRLVGQGHAVTLADDTTVAASQLAGIDLVLISSSTGSGEAGVNGISRNNLRTGRIPVICYEPGLYDELLFQTQNVFGNANGHTSLAISEANKSHPLAAGKSGTIDIVAAGDAAVVSSSAFPYTVGNSAIIIATNATPDIDVGRICIWAYETGSRLADNATVTAGRKIAFFYNATTAPGSYNANAIALLDAALKWALEPPASVPITIASRSPDAGQTAVPLDTSITVALEDGSASQVSQNSIRLSVNGTALTPAVTKAGTRTTISGKPAAPLPRSSLVTVALTFSDTATPPNSFTNSWQFTTDRPALALPAFSQSSAGLVVIEAENFHTNAVQGAHRWQFATMPANFSSEGTMNSLPDSGASINMPDALTTSARLDYKINFTKTGTHYLWIRGSDGGGDSIHAGIDDVDPTGSTLDNIDSPDCCGDRAAGGVTLVWINGIDNTPEGRSIFEIATVGEHTLHLWMREDGQIVDKLVITTDPALVVSGVGPEESTRVGQAIPPSVTSVKPAADELGVPVNANIEIVVTDGSTQLTPTSVQLMVNGAAVTPRLTKAGNQTTILYDPPSDLPGSSRVEVQLNFTDNATPPNAKKLTTAFTTDRGAIAPAPFQQDAAGLVAIEAENFHVNAAQGAHRWLFNTTPAGFAGAGTMYSLPESAASIGFPDAMTTSPRLDYKINFTKTGTHYLWVRGSDGGGDSIHAGIDNIDPAGGNLDNIDSPDCCGTRAPGGSTLVWINGTDTTPETRSTFNVAAAGEHTLHLWMREDGMIVDKVVITTDPAFTPTGQGPAETRPSGEPPKLSVARVANGITISWTGSGTLQQADAITGPWTGAPSQSNPQTVALTGTARFYRVR
jgi:hypothetical protein